VSDDDTTPEEGDEEEAEVVTLEVQDGSFVADADFPDDE
jgi:hypothetical protein